MEERGGGVVGLAGNWSVGRGDGRVILGIIRNANTNSAGYMPDSRPIHSTPLLPISSTIVHTICTVSRGRFLKHYSVMVVTLRYDFALSHNAFQL